jgi:hypothetical protein
VCEQVTGETKATSGACRLGVVCIVHSSFESTTKKSAKRALKFVGILKRTEEEEEEEELTECENSKTEVAKRKRNKSTDVDKSDRKRGSLFVQTIGFSSFHFHFKARTRKHFARLFPQTLLLSLSLSPSPSLLPVSSTST